ncbi:hypothetical protein PG996_014834 [Apiospora saccharicola]|uniref:J domain-containing protein n=1 Tax=Apiospora saccharicola TaxID=335842 RepID=A0ABR1TJE8_9PEZI
MMESDWSDNSRKEFRPDTYRRKDGEKNNLTKGSRGAMSSGGRPSPSTVKQAIDLVFETDRIMKGRVHEAIGFSRERDRRKYLEEIKALRWNADPTVPELVDFISRAFEIDQRFVRTVRSYAKRDKGGKEGGKRTGPESTKSLDGDADKGGTGLDNEGSNSGGEPPKPPRKPKLYSSCLMYMCSWNFVGEVIFWIFLVLLGITVIHQLFMRPESYSSRQQRYPDSRPPNYYAILGIDLNATDHEIRAAHRRQALIHHPDKINTLAVSPAAAAFFASSGDGGKEGRQRARETAAERMRLLHAAYQTLSNGEERCAYDHFDWPLSEGAVPRKNGYAIAKQYYRCLDRVQRSLFTKESDNGNGGDMDAKMDDMDDIREDENPSEDGNPRENEKQEEKVEEANVDVEKEKEEVSGSAPAKQETAVGGLSPRKRVLVYAEKVGAAYYAVCYGDSVGRMGLFVLMNAIAWRFGVELPDICLGGG